MDNQPEVYIHIRRDQVLHCIIPSAKNFEASLDALYASQRDVFSGDASEMNKCIASRWTIGTLVCERKPDFSSDRNSGFHCENLYVWEMHDSNAMNSVHYFCWVKTSACQRSICPEITCGLHWTVAIFTHRKWWDLQPTDNTAQVWKQDIDHIVLDHYWINDFTPN